MWMPSTRAWWHSTETGSRVLPSWVKYFPQEIRGLLSAGLGTG